jgi:methylenetetrahydrofolate reductase (NADPH)
MKTLLKNPLKNPQPVRISFEFYPPSSLDGAKNLLHAALELAQLAPEFFSVTFGAGGSTREGTIETVKVLQQKTTIPIAPHLSCIGYERGELINIINQYKTLGVKRIVSLRGDLPSGMVSGGEFKRAVDLVKLIRETTGNHFDIEVATYPEYHPQAKNAEHDVLNLKKKYEAGANCAITQYFFNPDAYFYFLDECASQQIFIPIVPGIMPILHFSKLIRFSDLCGAEIPRWLYKRLEAYGDDLESIRAFGVEVVYHLCERLLAHGAPGLHFYTLNHADISMQILKQLNLSVNDSQERRYPALGT